MATAQTEIDHGEDNFVLELHRVREKVRIFSGAKEVFDRQRNEINKRVR